MSSTIIHFFHFFFLFISIPLSFSQNDSFLYNGFSKTTNSTPVTTTNSTTNSTPVTTTNSTTTTTATISLNGISLIQDTGILRLTNETSRLIGRAFYPTPLKFKNSGDGPAFSFSTSFAFAMIPEFSTRGGHGLAFTIAPTTTLKGGLPIQYLGLLNSSDVGKFSNHVFFVEFDTVQDFEFGDINDNHVGININDMRSNASVPVSYHDDNGVKRGLTLKSGITIQAWVAYVGFSSSTGLLASSHYLFGWNFKMNGVDVQSLDLSSLPSFPKPKKVNIALIVGTSVSSLVLIIAAAILAGYLFYRIKNANIIEPWELQYGPHRFSYKELRKATKGFLDKELLGVGGFGKVYKGMLPSTKAEVAVKRVAHGSRQGLREFVAEIASIGRLRHRNLVQLQGWCRRLADLLLVYDYMPNGSLDTFLFDHETNNKKSLLSWTQRFRIIRGVASALLYLHEEWEHVVIHRDVKASNVLLDADMNGRLGDFGLAKLYEHGANPSTTRVVGTLGYLAPELTKTGKATTSSDVFAFGATMLEVVCGRRPIEPKSSPETMILVDWVWEKWSTAREVMEVVDPRLEGDYLREEVELAVKVGLMCSHPAAPLRPTMREVVRYLDGDAGVPEVRTPPDDYEGRSQVGFDDYLFSYPSTSFEQLEKVENKVTHFVTTTEDCGERKLLGSSSPLSICSTTS